MSVLNWRGPSHARNRAGPDVGWSFAAHSVCWKPDRPPKNLSGPENTEVGIGHKKRLSCKMSQAWHWRALKSYFGVKWEKMQPCLSRLEHASHDKSPCPQSSSLGAQCPTPARLCVDKPPGRAPTRLMHPPRWSSSCKCPWSEGGGGPFVQPSLPSSKAYFWGILMQKKQVETSTNH